MRRLVAATAVVLLLSLMVGTACAVQYAVTDLGTLGGAASQANAINQNGQVVGWSNGSDGYQHGFLWNNGGMADLGTFHRATSSEATGINASGYVAGWGLDEVGTHLAFFDYGIGLMDIGSLGGQTAQANALNDSNQIVGYAATLDGKQHAFLCDYNLSTMTDLGTLGGTYSQANAINTSGQVAGASTNAGSNLHAFLYSSGSLRDLGTLGGAFSYASGINDGGQVVGWAYNGSGNQRAFLYSGGTMADLGTLAGDTKSQANGINGKGQVVGYSLAANGNQRAFLYSGGTMTDLNTLINPASGWVLTQATAINDSGQIICNVTISGLRKALLLTPASFPGDANLDGKVDIVDLNRVLTNYNKNGMAWGDGDFDANGAVDVTDLNKVLTNYNKTAGASAGIRAVPEPASIILLAVGGVGLLACGRRCRHEPVRR